MDEATARALIRERFEYSGERIYFGDPWEPPVWPAQWVEQFDPSAPDT